MQPLPPGSSTARPYVNVLGKAIMVLDALHGSGGLTLAELRRRVGLSRTTIYRILLTLEQHGFVERANDRYSLGLRLFVLGSGVQERLVLARLAHPHLVSLAEEFRVSSFFSLRDGDTALCVDRVDRGGVQLAAYQIGETLPLHVGAGPAILLAGLPDSEIDRLLSMPLSRPTQHTISDPDAIRRRVADIRASGIAYADSDLEVGVLAIGAAVADTAGHTMAALSIAALGQQVTPERRERVIDALRNAAAILGRDLEAPMPAAGGAPG